jgi:hypothetical protein
MRFSHTLKTVASPEAIWKVWTDVERWSHWDTELRDAYLKGAFVLGTFGQLTPKRGRATQFQITQLTAEQSYTFMIALPFCTMSVYRFLSNDSEGVYFTHEVTFRGILAFLFGLLLGRRFQAVLPQVMENVKRIAETS